MFALMVLLFIAALVAACVVAVIVIYASVMLVSLTIAAVVSFLMHRLRPARAPRSLSLEALALSSPSPARRPVRKT